MKIVIQHLESIEGVEIFGIISLLIFFTIFTVMLIHTLRIDKSTIEECGKIPLEGDDDCLDTSNE